MIEELKIALFYIPILLLACLITLLIQENKRIGADKWHEVLKIAVPKGTCEKLKAYALLKGYKSESEFIANLIDKEIQKDREKLNK